MSNLAICLIYGLDFKILVDELKKKSSTIILVNLLADKSLQSMKETDGLQYSGFNFVKRNVQLLGGLPRPQCWELGWKGQLENLIMWHRQPSEGRGTQRSSSHWVKYVFSTLVKTNI